MLDEVVGVCTVLFELPADQELQEHFEKLAGASFTAHVSHFLEFAFEPVLRKHLARETVE